MYEGKVAYQVEQSPLSSVDCEAGIGTVGMNDCVRCMKLTELLCESLAILMAPVKEIPRIKAYVEGELRNLPVCTCPPKGKI